MDERLKVNKSRKSRKTGSCPVSLECLAAASYPSISRQKTEKHRTAARPYGEENGEKPTIDSDKRAMEPLQRPQLEPLYEFSSLLKFVERRFGLEALGDRDRAANDLLDSFYFDRHPLRPLLLQPPECPHACTPPTRETSGPA